MTTTKNCSEVPVIAQREERCQEPYHWDDGLPYCDTCGLYRNTIVVQERARRGTKTKGRVKPDPTMTAQPSLADELDLLISKMRRVAVIADAAGCPRIATSVRAIMADAVEWRRRILAGLERLERENKP